MTHNYNNPFGKKGLQISIPEPCHEDWNQMTPMERGRFCDACQKNVWDFTKASDRELYRFFENKPQGVCGRFSTHQLNRDIVPMVDKPHKRAPWYFAGVLSLGSLWANAQDIPETEEKPNHSVVVKTGDCDSLQESINGIHFTVTDNLGDPLAHALIVAMRGDQIVGQTTTDGNGKASLGTLEGRATEEIEYTIRVEINGYHRLEVVGNLVELNGKSLDIVLDRKDEFEIQTVEVVWEKPLIEVGGTCTVTTGGVQAQQMTEEPKVVESLEYGESLEETSKPKWWQFWK